MRSHILRDFAGEKSLVNRDLKWRDYVVQQSVCIRGMPLTLSRGNTNRYRENDALWKQHSTDG